MKTSELTGAALDLAVAKVEGQQVTSDGISLLIPAPQGLLRQLPSYSTDWAQGGAIIEREHIAIQPSENDGVWIATQGWDVCLGSTPLVAAMRCYVARKLGGEVEIPEALNETI